MRQNKTKRYLLEVVGIVLFIVVLYPFWIVLINSAKSSDMIIRNPTALPKHFTLLFSNMNKVIHNPNMNYWSSFFDSAFITAMSLITIVLFS
ncbi:MAG: carbohydrate ABC transporter permease, partial [Treponema sp.]|nr:carbohydrate ABC transporter permease [Treponema sp.]